MKDEKAVLKELKRIADALEKLEIVTRYAVETGLVVLPDTPASDN